MIKKLLTELKDQLEKSHKENFTGLVLFGSYARNTQNKDSDVDLIATFKDLPESRTQRIEIFSQTLVDLELKYNINITLIAKKESELKKSALLTEIADYAKILIDKNIKLINLFKSIQKDYKNGFVKKLFTSKTTYLLKLQNV